MGNVGSSGRESRTRTKLKARTREQQSKARLEILTVWEDCIVKQTKYGRWLAGWRKGGKLCKVYLGSCRIMGRAETLQNVRKMKAEALDKAGPGSQAES